MRLALFTPVALDTGALVSQPVAANTGDSISRGLGAQVNYGGEVIN